MEDVPDSWKAATARLIVRGRSGTGYLVAPNRIATCHHLLDGAREVSASLGEKTLEASLVGEDRERDVAILAFEGSVDAEPLTLAEALRSRAQFRGFGFSSEAGGPGRAFDGVVLNWAAQDVKGRRRLQVYSEAILQGRIPTRQGFCGSPLWIDGAVVGHLTRELGESEGLGGSYGIAYASPPYAWGQLLDVEPVIKAISPVTAAATEYSFNKLDPGHYHVFISCRSTDRLFASSLAKRMEGAGLRVFLDQRELGPGDPLAPSLEQAITKSRSAVVLVSRQWLESSWCQKEASVLRQRAFDQSFGLIALRLDDSEIPTLLGELACLDFRGQETAEGPNIDRLLHALQAQSAPGTTPTPTPMDVATTRILDAFLRQLRAAAKIGWKRLRTVVEDWKQYGSEDKTPLLEAAELLIGINRPTNALEVLATAGSGPRARQLAALALDKSGDTDKAIQILETLYDEEHRDPETGGILAGIYKRRWRVEGNRAVLQKACGLYKDNWEQTGDTYNGVNASALTLQLGESFESRNIAIGVLEVLQRKPASSLDQWTLATVGEAHLLMGDLKRARDSYAKAVAKEPYSIQDIAVMRTQARMTLKALGKPEDTLDPVFPVPTIIAFAGHMVDTPDRRDPRFPPEKERDVRLAIRKCLQELGQAYAYCSAARGSDIIFLEELLDRGGQARIILPFQVEDYKRTSVGQGWEDRFDKVLGHAHVELVVPDQPAPQEPKDLQKTFMRCSKAVYTEASLFARGLDQRPILLAVWDGKAGDGPGGTADAIRVWKAQGHEVRVLDVHDPQAVPASPDSGRRSPTRIGRKQALLGVAGAVAVGLFFVTLAWKTDVILDTRQLRGVKPVSAQALAAKQETATFDASQSAGLFVGVRRFEDDAFAEVPYAADDAVDLAHLFSLELRLIQPDKVVLALSGEPQKWVSTKRLRNLVSQGAVRKSPTRSEVIRQLRQLRTSSDSGGLVLVTLATHGFIDDGDYLLAYDSVDGRVKSTGIGLAQLLDDLSLATAPRRVVFVDACRERLYGGARGQGTQGPEVSKKLAEAIGQRTGLAVLSAAPSGGFSYDDADDKNGVFSKAILDGLGGKAGQLNGFITVETLAEYVEGRVVSWVKKNRPAHENTKEGISNLTEGSAKRLPLAQVQ